VHYYQHWVSRGEWYYADQTFAAFVKSADVNAPGVSAALAYASGEKTVTALRNRTHRESNNDVSALVRLWDIPERSERGDPIRASHKDDAVDNSVRERPSMPAPEDFPPSKILDYIKALESTRDFTATSKLIIEWFSHWESKGKGAELLNALERMLESSTTLFRGTELLDPAFNLSRKLYGPKKSIRVVSTRSSVSIWMERVLLWARGLAATLGSGRFAISGTMGRISEAFDIADTALHRKKTDDS